MREQPPPPIIPPSPDEVVAFWGRAIAAGAIEAGTPLPTVVEAFGDSAELADELLALVIDGPKRATAGSVEGFAVDGDELRLVGDCWIATDGAGRPRAVIRTTDVRIGPLDSVDDAFAWDEGEDDRTRASWLREHERFFRRDLARLGIEFDPQMSTIFERFEVPFSE